MNKNTLKRVFSALAVSAVAVSTTSMFASAETLSNPCDLQDNKEAAYVDFYSTSPNTKITAAEAANAETKLNITIDKIDLTLEQAKANPVQTVNFNLAGEELKISTFGLHPIWDTRLTVEKSGLKYVKRQDAFSEFSFGEDVSNLDKGYLTVTGMCDMEANSTGSMFSINFRIPDNAKAGDLYPIGIRYQNPGNTMDQFTGLKYDSEACMLMEAYVFTQGITNGYIKIQPEATSSSTSSTTTTTTTTTGAAIDTTTTTTGKKTTTTTKAKTTAKPKATTTKKQDPPKTGVAGVGIATAGLAVAIGTAFVLRKKED
ncbi:MAG: NPXTG-anchored protein [Ruminococcus sp.]|nr:NPXTG-anchored protein [Ruminococcus sp.]